MVINVTFRHNTQNDELKKLIYKQSYALKASMPEIKRLHAIFSVVSHKIAQKPLLQCHLSLHLSHQKYLNAFDEKTKPVAAFYAAFNQLTNELSRIKPTICTKKHMPL
jgi:ribosome-associated translation inhibitor RaiA